MCGAAVKIDKIGIIMTHTIFSMNIQIQVWFIWNAKISDTCFNIAILT